MIHKPALIALLSVIAASLLPVSPASSAARSPIRVGVADQSPRMFGSPDFQRLNTRITRYFVPSDVMQDGAERAKARAFVQAARASGVSTLLHISTTDLREKRGPVVSTGTYRRNAGRIVSYFRKLGVRDFGAWNEVNHKTQETWNRVGNAVSYYKSMYSAVRRRCRSCQVVGLDMLDQAGSDRYIRSFYSRLSSTWRKRLKVVGIHNYSDVNRNRDTGTRRIIATVRRYNRSTKFWFTETGALASFQRSFPYSESRQAGRIRNMFTYANRYRRQGVQRVYSYNWFGTTNGGCGRACPFDAGLVDPDGTPRPVYRVFAAKPEELLALVAGRVDERQQLGEPGDLQHALDLARTAPDRQREARLVGARVALGERAQAGGVHERQLAQVEHELGPGLVGRVGDRLLELGRRRDVELARGRDARGPVGLDDLELEGRDRHAREGTADLYRPGGWRATNPPVPRIAFCQREPVDALPVVSKRTPATTMKTCPGFV